LIKKDLGAIPDPFFFMYARHGAQRRDWRYPIRCGGELDDLEVKVLYRPGKGNG